MVSGIIMNPSLAGIDEMPETDKRLVKYFVLSSVLSIERLFCP